MLPSASGRAILVSGFDFRFLGFRVSGLGFRVLGFGSRVPGFGFRVSGFGSAPFVLGTGFRIPDFKIRVSSSRNRVSGFCFTAGKRIAALWFHVSCFVLPSLRVRVSGFGFRVSGSGPQVLDFEFRVPCFGFRVSGTAVSFPVSRHAVWCTRESLTCATSTFPTLLVSGITLHASPYRFSLCFCVSCSGFRVPGFDFRVSGIRIGISGFGFREFIHISVLHISAFDISHSVIPPSGGRG